MSVDYYARLERGNLRGVSNSVLDALARALQLDGTERGHLFDLAAAADEPTAPARGPDQNTIGRAPTVRSSVRTLLDALTTPAYVTDEAMNVVAANDLAVALFDGLLASPQLPFNLARFFFLDPVAKSLFLEWDAVADDTVAALRLAAGRTPRRKKLLDLIGELSVESREFVTRWARHDVRAHRTAPKRLHNSLIGDIDLTADLLDIAGDGLLLVAYTATPGSPAADALGLLASWTGSRVAHGRALLQSDSVERNEDVHGHSRPAQ